MIAMDVRDLRKLPGGRRMTAERISPARCLHFFLVLTAPLVVFLSGCGNKFFDPAQVGRFRPVPAVNVILDSLGIAEETPPAWEGAEEPLPVDIVPRGADYTLRAGDMVTIDIYELLREGVHHVANYVVTETGKISIPDVGVVQAAGLTETQLEDQIKKVLSPNILKKPSVTVTLLASQQRAFSVLGDGVQFPGRYSIPRYDFRLTDALATAGGSSQFNASYIYVSRFIREGELAPELINPGYGELKLGVVEPDNSRRRFQSGRAAAPQAQRQWPRSNVVVASSEMIGNGEQAPSPYRFDPYGRQPSRQLYANNSGRALNRGTQSPPAQGPASVDSVLQTLAERTRGARGTNPPSQPGQAPMQPATPTQPQATTSPLSPQTSQQGETEWVFQNGKWIQVQVRPQR
ncbi:MAG: polysaccharide biosynthesis/export family protein, partial [Sedimentisphaerales bacterium]